MKKTLFMNISLGKKENFAIKFNWSLFVIMIAFVTIVFVSNQSVYAVNPCIPPTAECITFNTSSYIEDNGAYIKVLNPPPSLIQTNAAGLKFVIIQVVQTSPTPPPSQSVNVALIQTTPSSSTYAGYVYFQNTQYVPPTFITPVLIISDIADQTSIPAVTVKATFDSHTDSVQITTANYDRTGLPTGNPVNWITTGTPWGLPPANQLPNTRIETSCSTGLGADGICPAWKVTGQGLVIPYAAGGGSYTWACNPNHHDSTGGLVGNDAFPEDPQCPTGKDIYVQVDWLQNQKPPVGGLNQVITSFAKEGITLHVQMGNLILFHKDTLSMPIDGGSGGTDFDTIKRWFFGTAPERTTGIGAGNVTYSPNLTAKRQVFHYALFIHAQTGNTRSGYSEQPGNDVGVSLGDFVGGIGSWDEVEGTFMHELGHNLGLQHGGGDSINCKPIYPSVMNYAYQFSNPLSTRPLNYSSGTLGQLTESTLTESSGVTSSDGHKYSITWAYGNTANPFAFAFGTTNSGTIDWDKGIMEGAESPTVPVSLSNMASVSGSPQFLQDCTDTNGPMTTSYSDFNDWGNLVYDFRNLSGSAFFDSYQISLANHTTIKLSNDTPSDWTIKWVQTFGMDRMKKSIFKIPTEISEDEIKEMRAALITSINLQFNNLNNFNNNTENQTKFDKDANQVYDLAEKNDLIGALQKIGDLKADGQSFDNKIKDEFNQSIDNVIGVYVKALTTPDVYQEPMPDNLKVKLPNVLSNSTPT